MRNTLKLALLAAAALVARPAAASVTYAYALGTGTGFTYTAPEPIIDRVVLAFPTTGGSCTAIAAFGTCQYAQLEPAGTAFNQSNYNRIIFTTSLAGNIFSYFSAGSFLANGTYTDVLIPGRNDTLTVSGVVPEPATFAALALGLGLVGVARRRRHA